jgi:hypothetical protein
MRVVRQRLGLGSRTGGRHVAEREPAEPAPLLIHASDPLPCAKVSYPSEDAAEEAARRYGQRPYECFCGAWHLTSRRRS